MHIKKREDGKYRVFVVIGKKLDGRSDKVSKVCETYEQAVIWGNTQERKRDALKGLSDRITVSEFIEQFFWADKKNLRGTTLDGYRRDVKRIVDAEKGIGNIEIGKLTRMHVQQLLNELPTRKVGTNTRETLRSVLGSAQGLGLVTENVASGRFAYPDTQPTEPDAYGVVLATFDEHAQVLDAVRDHVIEPVVLLGLCFGLRKGEILGLDWCDVNLDAREIRVRQTYTYKKGGATLTPLKTGGSYRTIPMNDYAVKRLTALLANHQARYGSKNVIVNAPVCVNTFGRRMSPNAARDMLHRFRDRNELPAITIFSMRHSFATACVNADIDYTTLAAWLGHTNPATTLNKYVKTTRSMQVKYMSEISQILRASGV